MDNSYEKVCVLGLGYIGLPTASLLATKGFHVHGTDVDAKIVETIQRGEIHITEPDLDILVKSAVQSGRLKVSSAPVEADVFIIAVPTPFKDNHIPDLSFVMAASESLAPVLRPGNLVVLESTSPAGTTEKIAEVVRKLRPDLAVPETDEGPVKSSHPKKVYFAHCPERVLPGQILRELIGNDRVIGGLDAPSGTRALEFYSKFVGGQVHLTDARTAELCKLTENAYRDLNIAFANELSLICDRMGINVWELIELANKHPRVNILKPGPGVGGHCIAVDPWFIVSQAPDLARVIRAAREVNDSKPRHVIDRVKKIANKMKSPKIACLGLTFKADVDDVRESPSLHIVESLARDKVGELLIVDPYLKALPKSLGGFSNVQWSKLSAALEQADIIVLLVDHKPFLNVPWRKLTDRVVVDVRGVWR